MNFNYLHPFTQLLLDIPLLPCLPNFVPLFFHWSSPTCAAHVFMDLWSPTGASLTTVLTNDNTPKENRLCHCQQPRTAHSSKGRVATYYPRAEIWSGWGCIGLVYAVTIDMCHMYSYPVVSREQCFLVVIYHFRLFHSDPWTVKKGLWHRGYI